MSIFGKFRKKKESVTDKSPEKVSEQVKEEKPDKKSDKKIEHNYALNPEITVKKNTPMYELWKIYQTESKRNDTFSPLEYIEEVIIDTKITADSDTSAQTEAELLKFIREIQKICERHVTAMKTEKRLAEREKRKPAFAPVNAETVFHINSNKTRLWTAVIPPLHGGEETDLRARMESMGIKYGIDEEAVNKITEQKQYLKIIQIAAGRESVNGKDGSVRELFSRENNHINIKEDDHGNVNYKELNMIQSIHKGDVICEITLPTMAVDGMTVTGSVIKGRDGKFPLVPAGKNTELTDDKTLLVSKIDGEVAFEGGKFTVRDLLTIDHDVDNSVGNINFTGNVLIKGDVREGYTVRADGDIRIIGTVEGASVYAGGDLIIERGMTGGNKGIIKVQGALKCKYLENCRVYAKAGIEAEQIMYSILSTDEDIIVQGKKGSVTGGKLIAGRTIDAVTIGTPANTNLKTEVVIGVVPHLIETEKKLSQQAEEMDEKLHKMSQDITYINSKKEKINEERKELLKKLIFQYQIDSMQKKKLDEELESVREQIQSNTEACSLRCQNVYPILSINVCGSMYLLDKELKSCRVSRKGEKSYIASPVLAEMIEF